MNDRWRQPLQRADRAREDHGRPRFEPAVAGCSAARWRESPPGEGFRRAIGEVVENE